MLIIVGAVSELERSLIRERVQAGMRRAKLESRHVGRPRLPVDRVAILQDRAQGMSLNALAQKHQISKASICKLLKDAAKPGGQKPPS